MANVFKFWVEKGADGFRIDAINHVFEDKDLRDEPPNPDWTGDQNDHRALKHIYTLDNPEVLKVVRDWRVMIEKYVADNPGEPTR